METYINPNPKQFQRFKEEVGDGPVTMLNLLKYKAVVEETGKSGKEAYNEYLNTAKSFLENVNAKVLFVGSPKHMLIGPVEEELWDAIIIGQYNSFADFVRMGKAEGYPYHLRVRALQNSRLIHCKSN